ncbi:MAG: BrnT family toxin [Halothece sp.]
MRRFDWDENKRFSNIEKHGIDFYTAYLLLQTEGLVQEIDNRKDYGEPRYKVTGRWGDRILVVVYAVRNSTIRIISVRRANYRERQLYWKERQKNNYF